MEIDHSRGAVRIEQSADRQVGGYSRGPQRVERRIGPAAEVFHCPTFKSRRHWRNQIEDGLRDGQLFDLDSVEDSLQRLALADGGDDLAELRRTRAVRGFDRIAEIETADRFRRRHELITVMQVKRQQL